MTTGQPSPGSMRFEIHEVLSGMLASVEAPTFTDDPAALAKMFEDLSGRFSLFAPFQAGVDAEAVGDAVKKLEQMNYLEHDSGKYTLTEEGRAHCVSSKRTLFNKNDREQLEEAATVFDEL